MGHRRANRFAAKGQLLTQCRNVFVSLRGVRQASRELHVARHELALAMLDKDAWQSILAFVRGA